MGHALLAGVGSARESYAVYAHLRHYDTMCQWDDGVRLLAQDDARAPVQGTYPVTLWTAGQLVKDTYFIPAPAHLLDAEHTAFTFGMTTAEGQRFAEFCVPLHTWAAEAKQIPRRRGALRCAPRLPTPTL
ncbi:MAG: hypothetical protein U0694_26930 [Anaerolineae bacterium]